MTQTVYTGAYLPVVTGDTATWGTKLNTETFVTFDAAIGGIASQTLTNADVTLSATQSGAMILTLNGTLTGNRNVTTSKQGICVVENNTSGNYTVTYTNGVGASVVVPRGVATVVASDSSNGCFQVGAYQLPANVALTGTLSVGGTTTLTGAVSLGAQAALTEISTPSAPSSGSINIYGYAGDYLASQTPGGVQRLHGKDPSYQRATSGSGTLTPSTGVVRWHVKMVAGGGGGGNGSSGNGQQGGTTSLGSWTAIGGNGGQAASGNGGAGGNGGSNGTGILIERFPGQAGSSILLGGGSNFSAMGGNSRIGGGAPSINYSGAVAGITNTGGGGGGQLSIGTGAGSGGGGGEYVEFQISNPTALSFAVGAGGSGGGLGADGGSGSILVIEYYS